MGSSSVLKNKCKLKGNEALGVYRKLCSPGGKKKPSAGLVVAALKACSEAGDVELGQRIHSAHSMCGSFKDPAKQLFLQNSLLDLYIKCGRVSEARHLFDAMEQRSVVSWTSMILGHVKIGQSELGLDLFTLMQEQGLNPDARSFVAALKALSGVLSNSSYPDQAARLLIRVDAFHSELSAAGYDSDPFVASSLIDVYSKLGRVELSQQVFNKVQNPDLALWNSIILANAENGEVATAFRLLSLIQSRGFQPNSRTFLAALCACSRSARLEVWSVVDGSFVKANSLEKGAAVHAQAAAAGCDHSEPILGNALIDFYVNCGSMQHARRVFDKMMKTSVASWSTMILGYAQAGQGHIGLQLYEAMLKKEGTLLPDSSTFVAVLKACSSQLNRDGLDEQSLHQKTLKEVRVLHSRLAEAGYELDLFVASALVDSYSKLTCLPEALKLFDKVINRDAVLWNSVIAGCTHCGKAEKAWDLFLQMHQEGCRPNARSFVAALSACAAAMEEAQGKSPSEQAAARRSWLSRGRRLHDQLLKAGYSHDKFVSTALVEMYSSCGSMFEARGVFEEMHTQNDCDAASWNSIIAGYSHNDQAGAALELFHRMQDEGFLPNARTHLSILQACSSRIAHGEESFLEEGRAIHSRVLRNGEEDDVFLSSALVDMYSESGRILVAQLVFDEIQRRNEVSWTTIISGYAQNYQGQHSLELFRSMQDEGVKPSNRTYTALLKACVCGEGSRASMLNKARQIHSKFADSDASNDLFLANKLVETYAKLGSMPEAREVFDKMQRRSLASWNSLITGYVFSGESNSALELFSRMREDDPGLRPDASTYAAVLKACAISGALEAGRAIHSQIPSAQIHDPSNILSTSLISFYGKCGSMPEALEVFESVVNKDLITWSSLLAGYSSQGECEQVLDLFKRMQNEQLIPDSVTLLHVLSACSHAGLVEEGKECFRAIWSDYGTRPTPEHWSCLLDLLGRANRLDEALSLLIDSSSTGAMEKNPILWETIMGASSKWKHEGIGRLALESLIRLGSPPDGAYVLAANSYS